MLQFTLLFSTRKIIVKTFFGSVFDILDSPFNNDTFLQSGIWRWWWFIFKNLLHACGDGYQVPPSVETGCSPYSFITLNRNRSATTIIFRSLDIDFLTWYFFLRGHLPFIYWLLFVTLTYLMYIVMITCFIFIIIIIIIIKPVKRYLIYLLFYIFSKLFIWNPFWNLVWYVVPEPYSLGNIFHHWHPLIRAYTITPITFLNRITGQSIVLFGFSIGNMGLIIFRSLSEICLIAGLFLLS